MTSRRALMAMEDVTDPVELARGRARDEHFRRDLAWFEAHARELGSAHPGKCTCIAGEELCSSPTRPRKPLPRPRRRTPRMRAPSCTTSAGKG
jgi:hypothetical protein